jgi:hypothetical protein
MKKSIRTQIRENLEHGLSKIKARSGYHGGFSHVRDFPEPVSNVINFPSVNLRFTSENYTAYSLGYLVKTLTFTFDVWVRSIDSITQNENKVIHDIERYFMINPNLPGKNGVGVRGDFRFTNNSRKGRLNDESTYGYVSIEAEFRYLQNLLDPTLTTQAGSRPSLSSVIPKTSQVSRKNLIDKSLILNLKRVTGGDYNSSLKGRTIYTRPIPVDYMSNYPYINIESGFEDYDQTALLQGRTIKKVQPYTIQWTVKSTTQSGLIRSCENALADMERILMNNFSLPDHLQRKTVTEVQLSSNNLTDFGEELQRATMNLDINCIYYQKLTEPRQNVYK